MLAGKGQTLQLVGLRAPISNGALAADKLPGRLKILGWGDNPSVKGVVKLSDLSASRLPARQAETGFDRVALDFEHNTVPGSPEYERSQEPRKVAAYGNPRIVPGDGLFLENLEWTPAGKAEALNYADLSPAVEFDESGNITFVHSVALTRNGAVEGLSFFTTTMNSKPMDPLKPENIIAVAELAPAVGLAATAPKADVLGKLKDMFAAIVAFSAALTIKDNKIVPLAALDERVKKIEDAGNKQIATLSATLDGKVITLSAEDLAKFGGRIEKLEATVTATNSAVTDRERNELLARFSADGKVPLNADHKAYTADELRKLDLATLKLLHANTPATVPLHARGRAPAEGGEAAPTPEGFKNLVTLHVGKGLKKSQALDKAIAENPAGYKAWRDANGQPGL